MTSDDMYGCVHKQRCGGTESLKQLVRALRQRAAGRFHDRIQRPSLLVTWFLSGALLRSPGQQLAHVVVARLRKVFVILTDSLKE